MRTQRDLDGGREKDQRSSEGSFLADSLEGEMGMRQLGRKECACAGPLPSTSTLQLQATSGLGAEESG